MEAPRIVLFDVYKTLLQISPRSDEESAFHELWKNTFGNSPPCLWKEVSFKIQSVISTIHLRDRSSGVPFPEIQWPFVLNQALEELAQLPEEKRLAFEAGIPRCTRTLKLMPGAGELLEKLGNTKIPCGIVSNAQAYTLQELSEALSPIGKNLSFFDPDLIFWSFRHGFSKPDPHVFQILAARTDARGIPRHRVWMLGDRIDNDIEPARNVGFSARLISGPDCLAEVNSSIQSPN